ncbi:helix-turn-helix transcriptional regulator [Pseudoalteromonas sp. TB41]|uniref:helix-turn-helix domain-containing protein n=1 Tax=Pseudoalteromonas sp. TB41 TaxID=985149 RepID=UPI00041061EE|nr:helix-turn-helix transcriptional regulator [Pseudoalteromonas sp. TB41]
MSTSLGDKIKLIRGTTGLNQIKFSELVGIGISSYKKYESGNRDVGAQSLLSIANHPQFKKYALWLITGETNPAAGQFAPGDVIDELGLLNEEEFEEQFIDTSIKSLMMFFHLDWFRVNPDKKIDINDCGKLLLKDLKPIIDARASKPANSQKTA